MITESPVASRWSWLIQFEGDDKELIEIIVPNRLYLVYFILIVLLILIVITYNRDLDSFCLAWM